MKSIVVENGLMGIAGQGRVGGGRGRRGTVILLVVAVLALLAVIGTIYVVSARTERASSAAMNASLNLNLARSAIMNQAVEIMGRRIYGADGKPGSYATTGSYGTLPAILYEAPDANNPWLAANLHPQNSSGNVYSTLTPNAFDPSAGTYSLSLQLPPYSTPVGSTVVADQTPLTTAPGDMTTDDPPTARADSYMYLLPFSDASGVRYRYQVRIIDTSRMANLNTGSTSDAQSTSDTFGTYLDSVRLAPAAGVWPTVNAYFASSTTDATNASLLHVSTAPSNLGRSSLASTQGNAAFSLSSWEQQVLRLEKPTDLGIQPFDLAEELELRSYGEYGTPYHLRFALGNSTNYTTWLNTFSCAANSSGVWSSTGAGGSVYGNVRRRSYTTYSESRDLRPYTDPATKYTLDGANGAPIDGKGIPAGYVAANMFPASPAKVSGNPLSTTSSANDLMFDTARAASNIATLMNFSCAATNFDNAALTNPNWGDGSVSYSHEEACAFAANYCTARWNGFIADPSITAVAAYWLPAGPSFVDDGGICIRTATSNAASSALHREFGNASDLRAETTNKIYLGYSAQPFISEVGATLIVDDSQGAPGVVVASEAAVELFNPYPLALSLNGFHLKSGDGTTVDIDLTGQFVPANGYLVVTSSGHFDGGIPGGAQKVVAAGLKVNPSGAGDTSFILYRPYYPRSSPPPGTPSLAPIDRMNYASLVDIAGAPALPVSSKGDTAKDFSIGRMGGPWGPTVTLSTYGRTTTTTLGGTNAGASSLYPLPDRYAWPTQAKQGDPFGMGEFGRIIRLSNEFDGSSATGGMLPAGGTNGGLIADHISQLTTTTAPYSGMTAALNVDAQILFDFFADPRIYTTTPPSDTGISSGQRHDIRAIRLLEQLTMMDRYSENSIDIGGGVNDITKIRLPGQINVNTASGDVLRAIPNMTNQMVANILAYRNRTKSVTYGTGSAEGVKTSGDFSNTTTYPGSGIRSLAELLVPLTDPASATTIETRDLAWGPVCGVSTVRSDTFVVYGYLEALKVFPSNTTHNNGSDWYGTVTDSINAPATNLRVARRRWVAIVDRSFCNYAKTDTQHFVLPKVVAIKDLPQ